MPGPPPKKRSQRARANRDLAPQMELIFEPGEPPALPDKAIDDEGNLVEWKWSPLTIDWWTAWCDAPQSRVFSRSDWNSLLVAAFVADAFFKTRKVQFAAELRQREAAFGATPLDRLRLRMAWREDAEHGIKVSEAEEHRRQKEAREKYGNIRVVRDGTEG